MTTGEIFNKSNISITNLTSTGSIRLGIDYISFNYYFGGGKIGDHYQYTSQALVILLKKRGISLARPGAKGLTAISWSRVPSIICFYNSKCYINYTKKKMHNIHRLIQKDICDLEIH